MSEWTECTLGDVVTLQRGYDLPSRVRRQGCYPVLSSSGTTDWHAEYKVEGPGVVTGRYGTIGEVFYVAGKYWPLNTTLFVSDFKGNVPRFVYYLLKLFDFKKFSDKSAVPGVNRNDLYPTKIRLPRDRETQESIALVLHSLDDKIEHNNKLIKMLEEQVQLLYDYWFMQFDFPDENGRPYRSSGGKMVWSKELKREIPKGWGAGTLKDVADVVGGSTPSTSNPNNFSTGEDSIPWITPKDLSGNADFYIGRGRVSLSEAGRKEASLHYLPEGAILFSSRAPIGYIAIAANEVTTNQGFKSLVPYDRAYTPYLFFLMRSLVPYFVQAAGITTFKEVSGGQVKRTPLIIPETRILHSFEKLVAPLFTLRRQVETETRELTAQRDFLLPLLMSGQVTVAE